MSFVKDLFEKLRLKPRDKKLHESLLEHLPSHPIGFFRELIDEIREFKKDLEDSDGWEPDPVWDKTFRKTWQNTVKKETVQPLMYLKPVGRQELIDYVKNAEKNNLLVRAVGMGHSFSDVANATDVLVSMLNVKRELDVETDTLNAAGAAKSLYSCEAGMLVADLNTNLEAKGLAIPTMAAFDQETIYGAIATSTHGTGIRVAGMSEMLLSMDLVAAGGKVYRVEPSNGITDPARFAAKYPNGKITLIQDDDKFFSARVGMGLCGLVYSVVIEPVPRFYLKQRLWISRWSKIKPKLEDRSFFLEIDPKGTKVVKDPVTGKYPPTRAQVFVNPYETETFHKGEQDHTCVVQVQVEISKAEYDRLAASPAAQEGKVEDFIESIITNGSHGIHVESIQEEDKESPLAEIPIALLRKFINAHPELTPAILDLSLIVLLSGSGKIGLSYVVMNQGKLAFKNAGFSTEPGFAVDDAQNFIAGIEEILRTAKQSAAAKAYLTSPLGVRFVAPSPDYLSPEYGVDTCMIDIPLLLGTIGDDQMLDRMQRNLLAKGARPHWGKINNLVNGRELIGQMYPKFQAFLDTVAFFNPNGTFDSTFSYRTGMTEMKFDRQ